MIIILLDTSLIRTLYSLVTRTLPHIRVINRSDIAISLLFKIVISFMLFLRALLFKSVQSSAEGFACIGSNYVDSHFDRSTNISETPNLNDLQDSPGDHRELHKYTQSISVLRQQILLNEKLVPFLVSEAAARRLLEPSAPSGFLNLAGTCWLGSMLAFLTHLPHSRQLVESIKTQNRNDEAIRVELLRILDNRDSGAPVGRVEGFLKTLHGQYQTSSGGRSGPHIRSLAAKMTLFKEIGRLYDFEQLQWTKYSDNAASMEKLVDERIVGVPPKIIVVVSNNRYQLICPRHIHFNQGQHKYDLIAVIQRSSSHMIARLKARHSDTSGAIPWFTVNNHNVTRESDVDSIEKGFVEAAAYQVLT